MATARTIPGDPCNHSTVGFRGSTSATPGAWGCSSRGGSGSFQKPRTFLHLRPGVHRLTSKSLFMSTISRSPVALVMWSAKKFKLEMFWDANKIMRVIRI
jgi:hypothetical protein